MLIVRKIESENVSEKNFKYDTIINFIKDLRNEKNHTKSIIFYRALLGYIL
jgi:hypothetical protein